MVLAWRILNDGLLFVIIGDFTFLEIFAVLVSIA